MFNEFQIETTISESSSGQLFSKLQGITNKIFMMESILIKIADSWLRNLIKTADLVTCTEEILNGKKSSMFCAVMSTPKRQFFQRSFPELTSYFLHVRT